MKNLKLFEEFEQPKDVVRAINISKKISKEDVRYLAYKTTVPEYAPDFILAYDNIVELAKKEKHTKADIRYLKGSIDELVRLAGKVKEHKPDAKAKLIAKKISDLI